MSNNIKMYDPTRDYLYNKQLYDTNINQVLLNGNFINGKQVTDLEFALAKYIKSKYCVCVANGTDALQIALMALDIKPGDEIITTPFTWISTSEVISLLGAIPVFVDIETDTYNIDITKIEEKITEKTKGILPVSLYGQMPNFVELNKLANKYNLFVIEDGAQSFGAKQNDKYSLTHSIIGCTSFFPSKPLGCYGDGGALFTSDDDLYTKIKAIKNHGGIERMKHKYIGINSRLDTLQAAILEVKLLNYDESISKRNMITNKYTTELSKCKLIYTPKIMDYNKHCWAQYSLTTINQETRDLFISKLKQYGIQSSIFYSKPLHIQECFNYLGYTIGDFPISEKISSIIFHIPCYPELTDDETNYIINKIIEIDMELQQVESKSKY